VSRELIFSGFPEFSGSGHDQAFGRKDYPPEPADREFFPLFFPERETVVYTKGSDQAVDRPYFPPPEAAIFGNGDEGVRGIRNDPEKLKEKQRLFRYFSDGE
jgi:hypothetical protein